MPVFAAIDLGSNAFRLAIATVGPDGHYEQTYSGREAVRLGQEVFASGKISAGTIDKALEAVGRFREQIDRHGAASVRAVATSAVREATNGGALVEAIQKRCGVAVSVISPEEEARLVHLTVKESVNLKNRLALLVDIGGGSVEVSVATHTGIVSTESHQMGSVRLLQILEHQRLGEKRFNQLVSRYVETIDKRLKKELGDQQIDYCIGTGGSIESIGELRRELLDKNNTSKVTAKELDDIVKTLDGMSIDERIERLHLRPDRADVIVPAAIVLQNIVRQAGVDEVLIPRVGVKEGLLLQMISEHVDPEKHVDVQQVITSALQLGRKYAFDEPHGVAVAALAVQMFDQTLALHQLEHENRVLLEVAALLHDIGQFIDISNHHKHTQYILQASSVIGLTPAQMEIVANVARYHRKSTPRLSHKNYLELSAKRRHVVSTLAAILRVANALDRAHAGNVRSVELTYRKPKFTLRLKGEGDMLLAKWALTQRADLFEEVFDGKLTLADN
jgi:exopolyphosphatase/guanosine-5'-triphosphate,3'-diphosphate pyrophosphatase